MENKAQDIKHFPLAEWLNEKYGLGLKTGFTVEVDPREQLRFQNGPKKW